MPDAIDDPDADLDFRTYIPAWLWAEYYDALGRLMHGFAKTEDTLKLQLALYAEKHLFSKDNERLSKPDGQSLTLETLRDGQAESSLSLLRTAVVRAVLGGSGFETLKGSLKRILRVTGADRGVVTEVDRVLSHFGQIQLMRNRLAHNSAAPNMTDKDGWFYTSNYNTVTEDDAWEIIYFKPEMLIAMERDLNIGLHLLSDALDVHGLKDIEINEPWRSIMNSSEMKALAEEKMGPWHYKASDLRRNNPNRPNNKPQDF
jgi:hypothetical protein